MPIKESSDALNPAVAVSVTEIAPPRGRTASDYIALAIATVGVGYFPIAPGTLGSLVGVALYLSAFAVAQAILLPYAMTHGLYFAWVQSVQVCIMLVLISLITFAGIWAASRAEIVFRRKDPSAVVIDEVAGQMIALLPASFSFTRNWTVITAFILFRAFDIWKPYPIRRLEALEGGLGVMADDVAAGLYAAVANSVLLALFVVFFLK